MSKAPHTAYTSHSSNGEKYETVPGNSSHVSTIEASYTAEVTKASVELVTPHDRTIVVGIDPEANVNTATSSVLENIRDIGNSVLTHGSTGTIQYTRVGDMVVAIGPEKRRWRIQCFVTPIAHLPSGCQALFSNPTLHRLAVDINFHSRWMERGSGSKKYPPVRTLSTQERARIDNDVALALDPYEEDCRMGAQDQCWVEAARFEAALRAEQYLSEKKVAAYLERTKGKKFDRHDTWSLEDVVIAPIDGKRWTARHVTRVKLILRRYENRFAKSNDCPPPLNAKPYRLQLKEGYEIKHCPKPQFRGATKEYWQRWGERMIASGLFELCNGPWASRGHLVLKTGPDGKAMVDFEIRETGDFVLVNTQLVKLPPNLPRPEITVQKHLDGIVFFQTDAKSAYHQLLLHEDSRDVAAIWCPQGKLRPTRLLMGLKNAGTVLQQEIDRAFAGCEEHIRRLFEARLSNYADDFAGSQTDGDKLLDLFEHFLQVCEDNNITLTPSKTKIGFATADFFGYTIGKGQISIKEANMLPLKQMKSPDNQSALRRVLGLLEGSRAFIQDFATLARPLTSVVGKKTWTWGQEQEAAFEKLRQAALSACKTHILDWEAPLYLFTDASDYGMGATLVQYGPNKEKKVIKYMSKAFKQGQLSKPVYYKEALAIIWAMRKCQLYSMNSPHELTVFTDHCPLKWIRHSTRGAITSWLVEDLNSEDFKIKYLPGPENVLADAMSRYPLLEPNIFNSEGIARALQRLLAAIDPRIKQRRIATWAGANTTEMSTTLRAWSSAKVMPAIVSPTSLLRGKTPRHPHAGDVYIVSPKPEDSPAVVRKLLSEGWDFACLIPGDLVQFVHNNDTKLASATADCAKLVFLDSGLVWLTSPSLGIIANEVFNLEQREDIQSAWVAEQQQEKATYASLQGTITEDPESKLLLLTTGPGQPARIIVPTSRRLQLMEHTHATLQHAGSRKMLLTLRAKYTWQNMKKDVRQYVQNCHRCILTKAKFTHKHGCFSPILYGGPGECYGIDIYTVAPAATGESAILTVVDLFTRWTKFIALLNGTAEEVIRALLRDVIYERGAPSTLVSDSAKAFVGHVARGLTEALQTRHVTTAYYPQGNSIVERRHYILGECFRALPKHQRRHWPTELPRISFAVNATVHETTQLSPFQIEYGRVPRIPFDLHLVQVPAGGVASILQGAPARYQELAEAMKKYREIAKYAATARQQTINNRLNQHSRPITYKPGDYVIIYAPYQPDPDGWRAKHTLSWRGPCKVLQKLGAARYQVQDLATRKIYNRAVTLMAKYTAHIEDENDVAQANPAVGDQVEGKVAVGDWVAAVDRVGDTKYYICKVTELLESEYRVQYLLTTDRNASTARFRNNVG